MEIRDQLQIKNMVCPRCISSVKTILNELEIGFHKVSLGEVILESKFPVEKEREFQEALKKEGFELITHRNKRIVNRIKAIIIEVIYGSKPFHHQKLSNILADDLHQDYSLLSNLFSKTEGKSIQEFQRDVKIIRIKELLEYDEFNISEIALDMGYGNAAYLSTQFKKATGMSPSYYKNLFLRNRKQLDEL